MYVYIHSLTHMHTYTYSGVLLSHKKGNLATTWVDLESIILIEISQSKTDTLWSQIWNQKTKLIDTENRYWWLPELEGRQAKWVEGIKKYKLPVISHEFIMYSRVTIVNTIMYV